MVAAGVGWIPIGAAAGESVAHSCEIVYRGWIEPPIPFALHLLSREGERSVLVERFVALARELRDDVPAPSHLMTADADAASAVAGPAAD